MRIIFADDHEMILDGLKNVVESHFKNATVFTALNKNELFIQLKASTHQFPNTPQQFDVLIQDIKFGKHNANDFLDDLKKEYPNIKILVLSSISDKISIQKILKKVDGYILKSESVNEIINGINSILNNETFVSPQVKLILGKYIESSEIVLTRREKEVLEVIMQEKSTKEIADILCISPKTVEMHRSNLFLKLNVKNITGLVKQVIAKDLLGN